MRTTTRLTLAPIVGIALVVGLAGCANPLEQLAQGGVEQIIESQTGVDTDIDINAEGGGSVPDGFPSAVPLIDGEIFFSQSVEDTYLLDMYVDSADQAEEGYQEILAAGFTETLSMNIEEMSNRAAENDEILVSYIVLTDVDGRVVVKYTVAPK